MSGNGIERSRLLPSTRYVTSDEPDIILLPNDGSQKNNKLAFEESVRAVTSLYEGLWHGKQEVIVEDALELTMAVSLAPPTQKKTLMYLFRRLS